MRRAVTITVSDRAFNGIYEDKSGRVLQESLPLFGYELVKHHLVSDDIELISSAIRDAIDNDAELIVTTGGTGLAPRDLTPEATRPFIEKELPGFSEALRAYGRAKIETADLSRGLAGTVGKSFIVNLPGSVGGVKDGLEIIKKLAPHIHEQLAGYDHITSN